MSREQLILSQREAALYRLMPVFVCLVVLFFAFEHNNETTARSSLVRELGAFSDHTSLLLDGRPFGEAGAFMALVNQVGLVEAHHSSPRTWISAEISDGRRTVRFAIARDSERPDEYWVYTDGRYAGRIVTKQLSAFLSERGF